MEALRDIVSAPLTLEVWAALVAISLAVLIQDLVRKNRSLGGLMKLVWTLTVLYSGPLGLGVYYFAGRSQIPRDTLWRRAWRSDVHCYSGCGAGEIIGVVLGTTVFGLTSNLALGLMTFAFAYVIGFALTLGPLMHEGESPGRALRDAFLGESTSITTMEIAAILVDLALAGRARIDERLFWASLVISLTVGLLVAYPVNVLLIRFGVKEGMMDPRKAGMH